MRILSEDTAQRGRLQRVQGVFENSYFSTSPLLPFYFFLLFYSSLKSLKERRKSKSNDLKYKAFCLCMGAAARKRAKGRQFLEIMKKSSAAGDCRDMQGCGGLA